jgi:hypothetical protein
MSLRSTLLALLAFSALAVPPQSMAQSTILAWDFAGVSSPVTASPTTRNGNLDTTALTRGSSAASSTASNSFRTQGFQNNGISTANTDYFQFVVSAATGYTLSLSMIDYRTVGTGTFVYSSATAGAGTSVSVQFAYSTDGTTFTTLASPAQTYTSQTTSLTAGPPNRFKRHFGSSVSRRRNRRHFSLLRQRQHDHGGIRLRIKLHRRHQRPGHRRPVDRSALSLPHLEWSGRRHVGHLCSEFFRRRYSVEQHHKRHRQGYLSHR